MIKLLFGRLLPMGGAVWLFTSALSPIRPALNAFATAADALTGKSTDNSGWTDPGDLSSRGGFFDNLFGSQPKESSRKQLTAVIEDLKARQAQAKADNPELADEPKPARKRSAAAKGTDKKERGK